MVCYGSLWLILLFRISDTTAFAANKQNQQLFLWIGKQNIHTKSCQANCCSNNVIYLLQCQKWKIQYIGKTENWKFIWIAIATVWTTQLRTLSKFSTNHVFNRDAKFTIIEQIKDNSKTKEENFPSFFKEKTLDKQNNKTNKNIDFWTFTALEMTRFIISDGCCVLKSCKNVAETHRVYIFW